MVKRQLYQIVNSEQGKKNFQVVHKNYIITNTEKELVVYFMSLFEVVMIGLNQIHCCYSLLGTTRTNTWTAPYDDFFDAYYQFREAIFCPLKPAWGRTVHATQSLQAGPTTIIQKCDYLKLLGNFVLYGLLDLDFMI